MNPASAKPLWTFSHFISFWLLGAGVVSSELVVWEPGGTRTLGRGNPIKLLGTCWLGGVVEELYRVIIRFI